MLFDISERPGKFTSTGEWQAGAFASAAEWQAGAFASAVEWQAGQILFSRRTFISGC